MLFWVYQIFKSMKESKENYLSSLQEAPPEQEVPAEQKQIEYDNKYIKSKGRQVVYVLVIIFVLFVIKGYVLPHFQ